MRLKIREIIPDYTCACKDLTNFECEGQAIGNYVNLQKLAWKNSWNHWVNLFSAGFSFLEPPWVGRLACFWMRACVEFDWKGGEALEKKVVVVARNKHVAGKTRFSSVTFKMRSRKILTLKRNLNSSYTHVSRIYGFCVGK